MTKKEIKNILNEIALSLSVKFSEEGFDYTNYSIGFIGENVYIVIELKKYITQYDLDEKNNLIYNSFYLKLKGFDFLKIQHKDNRKLRIIFDKKTIIKENIKLQDINNLLKSEDVLSKFKL